MKLEGFSHRRTRSMALGHYANRSELITCNCLVPWFLLGVLRLCWRPLSSVPKAWAKGMGTLGCLGSTVPFSVTLAGSKGKDEPIRLVPVSLQELPETGAVRLKPPNGAPLQVHFLGVPPSLWQQGTRGGLGLWFRVVRFLYRQKASPLVIFI